MIENRALMEYRLRQFMDNEIGLIGGTLKVNVVKSLNNLIAGINRNNWGVELNIDPDYKLGEKQIEHFKNNGITGDFEYALLKDILTHEGFHWKKNVYYEGYMLNGCPTDVGYYDVILDSVTKALKKKDKESRNEYIANAFMDVVVNTTAKMVHPPYSGQVIFFYDQGQAKDIILGTSEDGKQGIGFRKEKGYDKFYEAFVKLNMEAHGTDLDKEFLADMYKNEQEVEEAVAKLVDKFKITDDYESNAINLSRKKRWKKHAYNFADVMADLIDDNFMEIATSCHEHSKMSDGDKKKIAGDRYFGRDPGDDEKDQGSGGGDEGDEDDEGSSGSQRLRGGRRAGPPRPVPSYMKSYEFLSYLYDYLSSEIEVYASSDRAGFQLPLVQYGTRPFTENDNLKDMKFKKVIFDKESPFKERLDAPINFGQPRYDWSLQVPSKYRDKSLPDICLLMDTSGSMEWGGGHQVPGSDWSDESKYHYALLGFHGIMKYLQRIGIAPFVKYNLINFSNGTKTSGWKNYAQINDVKKLAFTPQFGGTYLDMDLVKRELNRPSCVSIMLSDGEIFNWGQINDDFASLMKKHYFSFISIEDTSEAYEDLKGRGFPVYEVQSKEDMTGLMIDLAKDQVRNYLGV